MDGFMDEWINRNTLPASGGPIRVPTPWNASNMANELDNLSTPRISTRITLRCAALTPEQKYKDISNFQRENSKRSNSGNRTTHHTPICSPCTLASSNILPGHTQTKGNVYN